MTYLEPKPFDPVLMRWPQSVEREPAQSDEAQAIADLAAALFADDVLPIWLPQKGGGAQAVWWPMHYCPHKKHDDMILGQH